MLKAKKKKKNLDNSIQYQVAIITLIADFSSEVSYLMYSKCFKKKNN